MGSIPGNVDIAIYAGHWPYHYIPGSSLSEIVGSLSRTKTETALISNLNSVFYKDPHEGYEELLTWVDSIESASSIKYLPIINPALPYWKDDYDRYGSDNNVAGLRLFPGYHKYDINDPGCVELLSLAGKDDIPVFITMRLENARMRQSLDSSADVPVPDIERLLNRVRNTRICLSQADTGEILKLTRFVKKEYPLYFDTATYIQDEFFEYLVANNLHHRLLFGSARPLLSSSAVMEVILNSDISSEALKSIMKDNALELMGSRL